MIHQVGSVRQQLNGGLRAERQPDDVRSSIVAAVPDQVGDPRGRIREGERRLGQAAAMFGQVGDEQMVVGKRLDLWLPGPPAHTAAMQEHDRGGGHRAGFADKQGHANASMDH